MTVCALLALSAPAFGQQDPSHPKKIMTPEQQQFQQQMREVDAQRQNLRAQAKQAFDAEMAREKSGDCPNATSTYEFNICYGKAVTVTDQNLTTYEKNIRDLLGLHYPIFTGQPSSPGLAGSQPTPEQEVAEFDHIEQLWRAYLDSVATTAFHQFDGGTGGPSFEMEAHLRLTRNHMREIDTLYGVLLHL
jgi:hypothetical protein